MISRIQLRQFLAVVDGGSFTRAAAALHLTQPSLSGGIAQLEQQLGTRLFVRERRRIRLTEAGNALLPLARDIERTFHAIESRVSSLPAPVRPIRLGVLETVSGALLEALVAAYRGAEPLELIEGPEREIHSALANGSIDIALTIMPQGADAGSGRGAVLLLEEDYCLVLPATHPLAAAPIVEARDVAGDTMLARRSCEVLAETSRFFTARGVRPRFALRSAHDERVMQMVRAGLGITVAPRSLGVPGTAMTRLAGFDLTRRIALVPGSHWRAQFGHDHALSGAAWQVAKQSGAGGACQMEVKGTAK